jgi:putative FmdB family regulatory protein
MPIYEYQCKKCARRFECLVQGGRDKEVVCPDCGAPEPQKLISAFGIGGGSSRIKASSSGCTTCSTKSCSTCH